MQVDFSKQKVYVQKKNDIKIDFTLVFFLSLQILNYSDLATTQAGNLKFPQRKKKNSIDSFGFLVPRVKFRAGLNRIDGEDNDEIAPFSITISKLVLFQFYGIFKNYYGTFCSLHLITRFLA